MNLEKPENPTAGMTPMTDVEKNRDLAAFAYILVFAPILIITRRDSPFIRHHALQALYLGVFFVIFALLPGKLTYLNILVVAGALMGFLEAQAGHLYRLPIISDLIVRQVTLQSIFDRIKRGLRRIGNIFQRLFSEGPGFAIRGTVTAVEKARGIDALKVNTKVEELKSEVEKLQEEVVLLEKKVEPKG